MVFQRKKIVVYKLVTNFSRGSRIHAEKEHVAISWETWRHMRNEKDAGWMRIRENGHVKEVLMKKTNKNVKCLFFDWEEVGGEARNKNTNLQHASIRRGQDACFWSRFPWSRYRISKCILLDRKGSLECFGRRISSLSFLTSPFQRARMWRWNKWYDRPIKIEESECDFGAILIIFCGPCFQVENANSRWIRSHANGRKSRGLDETRFWGYLVFTIDSIDAYRRKASLWMASIGRPIFEIKLQSVILCIVHSRVIVTIMIGLCVCKEETGCREKCTGQEREVESSNITRSKKLSRRYLRLTFSFRTSKLQEKEPLFFASSKPR